MYADGISLNLSQPHEITIVIFLSLPLFTILVILSEEKLRHETFRKADEITFLHLVERGENLGFSIFGQCYSFIIRQLNAYLFIINVLILNHSKIQIMAFFAMKSLLTLSVTKTGETDAHMLVRSNI